MFRRSRSLVLIGIVSMAAGGCPGGGGVICSNTPNLAQFGVQTIIIPADFACANTLPNFAAVAFLGYRQSAKSYTASVQILPPQSTTDQGGATTTDLGPKTTANGVTFNMFRVTLKDNNNREFFSYVGGVLLKSGNNLFITISAATDAAELQTILNTILESVVLN